MNDKTKDCMEEPKESQSTMSRGAQLAMELSKEKKRLQDDLGELQEQYENVQPTTPKGTADWYVKWLAVIMAVIGVFLISSGLTFYGQLSYIVSAIGWIYVGMCWKDHAIMIGSSITGTAVAMNLVRALIG